VLPPSAPRETRNPAFLQETDFVKVESDRSMVECRTPKKPAVSMRRTKNRRMWMKQEKTVKTNAPTRKSDQIERALVFALFPPAVFCEDPLRSQLEHGTVTFLTQTQSDLSSAVQS